MTNQESVLVKLTNQDSILLKLTNQLSVVIKLINQVSALIKLTNELVILIKLTNQVRESLLIRESDIFSVNKMNISISFFREGIDGTGPVF
jgi:hypothetical protein